MKKKRYIPATIILVLSFAGAVFLPVSDIFKGFASVPGTTALLYVLFQLMRDEWQYERNILLQNKQQNFVLSTSSHVAKVAYDKHVLFCEEYIAKIQEGRKMLLREGTSPEALKLGAELVSIRQKHSAWLTEDIENQLKPFEQALVEIGAKENYLRRTGREEYDERKREIVEKLYRSFGLVLGHESPQTDEEADLHMDKVIDKIRDILGIREMTKLRIKATKEALERLDKM